MIGVTTIALPESCSDDGVNLAYLILVAERIGRSLTQVPWIDHVYTARLMARLSVDRSGVVNGARLAPLDMRIA